MKNLYKKLFEIQGLAVKKDSKNPFYKSEYMSVDAIVDALKPLLIKHKLLVVHYVLNKELVTEVIDIEADDCKMLSSFPLVETNDPQKYGSAVTYCKRYNLGALFNITTDVDNDGNGFNKTTIKPVNTFKPVAKKVNAQPEEELTLREGVEQDICPQCGDLLKESQYNPNELYCLGKYQPQKCKYKTIKKKPEPDTDTKKATELKRPVDNKFIDSLR